MCTTLTSTCLSQTAVLMGPDTLKLERTPVISELGIFGTFLRYQGGKEGGREGERGGREGGRKGRGREEGERECW